MENWMKELGLVMNIKELGVTEDMIESIANVISDISPEELDNYNSVLHKMLQNIESG